MINQSIVLTKISNVITDITNFVTDVNHVGSSLTLAATDAIYIGSILPFNTLYLKLLSTAVNNNASVLSVAFWDATSFTDFYKVLDGTAVSGATLGKSGTINLIAKDDKAPCAYDSRNIAELNNVDGYYGMYWTRLKPSLLLDAITLQYVGQLFVDADTTLFMQYPDLNSTNYFKVFGATKTDWLDQRIIATDLTISELIARNQVISGEQFLDWRLMKEPALHKTAELIYRGMGVRYKDDMNQANKSFVQSLESRKYCAPKSTTLIKTGQTNQRQPMGFYR
jgi:hypothetical protein